MGAYENRRVEQVTYSHNLETDSYQIVGGFRQVLHLAGLHCVLDAENLVVSPWEQVAGVDDVEQLLLPILRGWELRSELFDERPLEFRKTGHRIRDLSTGGQIVGVGTATERESAHPVIAVTITEHVNITDLSFVDGPHPRVPLIKPLEISEAVEAIRDRWRDVQEGNERLLVGAYWILTRIVSQFGNRKYAAAGLSVAGGVLDEIGRLTASNDPVEGRKVKGDTRLLRESDRAWLKATIPTLIYRLAETEYGYANLPQITMSDLPMLES